ncbi:transposase [Actinomyces sp. Chiba101]|uniref:Transposase n=1 Tax=Actinomyces denticolens TaxID=52767 RepID=A0ABY1I238_9ACTO|nr:MULTISPECIES: hypothetical protein [Actinomyces]BAW92445.1 transposase [Actinomyces sp. Chiba101]GAV94609.1 transposase [Actinomyces denticolens]SHI47797.1 putative transposase [Actinomyces denticolens]SUU09098.1 Uncharacterised protein [Actinomyces denticolens]
MHAWKGRDEVEAATADWVSWYNTTRPHRYNPDYMAPAAAEALYYDTHRDDQKAAARQQPPPQNPGESISEISAS